MNLAASSAVDPSRVLDAAIEALNSSGQPLPLTDVDRALRVAPHDPRLWHVKGLIHREQERRELAIPALQQAVQLAPNEPLIAHGYARTLLEAGLPAVEAFARAVKLAPANQDVVKGLASALVAVGRIQDAIAGLEHALRRSPLWTDGHLLLSSLRWSEGEREGFTRSFDEALVQHPSSLDLRREQLIALAEAEHFDAALSRIAEGRARYGEQPLFVIQEAIVRSEAGDQDTADLLFSQLPISTNSSLDVRRVRHLLRSGRPEQAREVLQPWLERPEQDMFWPYAASAFRLLDDPRSEWLEGDERFVGVYDIAERLPPLDSVASVLRKLHISKSQFFSQSVRGGTQTDGNLFQRIEPEIVALREVIRQIVGEHSAHLPPIDNKHPLLRYRPERIQFTGSWSVRLVAGGNHANHIHPMGWLSSALYIVLPPDLGQQHAGCLTLGEPQAQLRLDLPPTRVVEPRLGRLALFPSWMWHGTRSFGEGERITIAFDVARFG